ncbi:MAG: flippase [Bacteroidales bacterium]|nr:flippase [Bacteroidales bacterium]
MEQRSLRSNYFYNLTLQALNIVYPLLLFTYVSRILGPSGVGKVNFASSFVYYFTMLASLGTPLYAIREIAKIRNDKKELERLFSELFFFNCLTAVLSSLVFVVACFTISKMQGEITLFLVTGSLILFNGLSIDWFYQGIEDYRFIAIRSIIIRFASLIPVFFLVRTSHDYVIFAAISAGVVIVNNMVNVIHVRKKIRFKITGLKLFAHVKQLFVFFSSQVAIFIYTGLDLILLGFFKSDADVGYYYSANRICKIVITAAVAYTQVLYPRLSHYYNEQRDQIQEYLKKVFRRLFFMLFFSAIFVFCLSREILLILAGNAFLPAVSTLQLGSLIILAIGLNNFTSLQVLLINNKEKWVLISVIIGAIVDLALNLILIPAYSYLGTMIALVVAESLILTIQIYMGRNYLSREIFLKNGLLTYLSIGFLLILLKFLIDQFHFGVVWTIISFTGISTILILGLLYVAKDPIPREILSLFYSKFAKSNK